jgi:signal transduction histidine kinase
VEFSQTIYSSGTDLLNLINDILDLSKVEAGKMEVNAMEVSMRGHRCVHSPHLRSGGAAEGPGAQGRTSSAIRRRRMYTDGQRLQQVLKNLLSNAFKFTESGGVTLTIRKAEKRQAVREPHPRSGGDRHRVRGDRYGHRHREGQAAADLRSVPAG